MATDTERLVISLEASAKKLENELRKARATTDRQLAAIEKKFSDTNKKTEKLGSGAEKGVSSLTKSLAGLSRVGLAATGIVSVGAAVVLAAKGFAELSNEVAKAENPLRVAGLAGEDLNRIWGEMFRIAQSTGKPIDDLTRLYGRLALSQKSLGVSSQDIIDITESVALSLKAQGADAGATASTITQLTQALGEGKVTWENFGEAVESNQAIAQVLADTIKEAGGDVGRLNKLVRDGAVSSKALAAALKEAKEPLQDMANRAVPTLESSWNKVKTAMVNAARETGLTEGTLRTAAAAANALATAIGFIAQGLQDVIDVMKRLDLRKLGDVFGEGAVAAPPTAGETPLAITVKPRKQISLADFPVPPDDKKSRVNVYEREIQQIRERTELLRKEAQVVGQGEAALAKVRAEQDLLNAAKEQGVALTPTVLKNIDAVAQAYADATKELAKAEKQHAALQDMMQSFESIASSAMQGFVSDLRESANAAEALEKTLERVVDQLLSMALNLATKGLFSGLGLTPKMAGGPVRSGQGYVVGERGPEIFMPSRSGSIVPNSALPKGMGGSSFEVNVINNAGAQITAQPTQEGGQPRLDVIVDRMIAQKLMTPGAESNRAMRTAFNTRSTITRR